MAPVPGQVREQHHTRISVCVLHEVPLCVRLPPSGPHLTCAPDALLHAPFCTSHAHRDLISAAGAALPTPCPCPCMPHAHSDLLSGDGGGGAGYGGYGGYAGQGGGTGAVGGGTGMVMHGAPADGSAAHLQQPGGVGGVGQAAATAATATTPATPADPAAGGMQPPLGAFEQQRVAVLCRRPEVRRAVLLQAREAATRAGLAGFEVVHAGWWELGRLGKTGAGIRGSGKVTETVTGDVGPPGGL